MGSKDMTRGNPWTLILLFALPMVAGNICQQLYTIVDSAFVGRFAGYVALAAVGSADGLNWLIFGLLFGFTSGFSILISQRFGAGDLPGLKKSVGISMTLTVLIAATLLVVSEIFTVPLLHLLSTPEEILPQAEIYIRIFCGGLPFIAVYNAEAAVLRAVGDSKSPFIAMIIAAFTNIGLDALFVVGCRWGVAGAALGTVLAQIVSALYCFIMIRRIPVLRISRQDFVPDQETTRELIRLGIPNAVSNTVIAMGGVVIQRVVNDYGTIFIAGYTATNKLYGLMEIAATSYGSAVMTYSGQNYGAGDYVRIQKGVRDGLVLSVITSFAVMAALLIWGRNILSLFVSAEEADSARVLDTASDYLNVMVKGLPVLYLLYVYRSALCGMGDTTTPLISGIGELTMRISTILILPKLMGSTGAYFAEVSAWIGGELVLMFPYYVRIRRLLKTVPPKAASTSIEA